MRLSLVGHDHKYAVEQVMLTLFPEERPVYADPDKREAISAEVRLSHGGKFSTAVTRISLAGKTFCGTARIVTPDPADTRTWNRLIQKIIRLSFFRAGVLATGKSPPWGALSGIRPGKRATARLEAGLSPKQVRRVLEREYQVQPARAALCIDPGDLHGMYSYARACRAM